MAAGPLSRLHVASDVLQLADEDSIPWTYVVKSTPEAEATSDDAVTYTCQGVSNKRRKMTRKKTKSVDGNSTKLASGADSLDWTDEEEWSLCQAVTISLQKTSCRDIASTKLAKELQTVTVSKLLAECLVPTHQYVDVVARVRSGNFRRTFISFLQSKAKQKESALSSVKTDNVARTRFGSSSELRDAEEVFSKSENCPTMKGQNVECPGSCNQNDCTESDQIQAETNSKLESEHDIGVVQDVPQDEQKQQGRSLVERRGDRAPLKKSLPRLKSKRHRDRVESTDKNTDRTAGQLSLDSADCKTEPSVLTGVEQDSYLKPEQIEKCEKREKKQTAKGKGNVPLSVVSSEPGKTGYQKLKRKDTLRLANTETERNIPAKEDLTLAGAPTVGRKLKNVTVRQRTKISQEYKETKTMGKVEEGGETRAVLLPADVHPLGNSQGNTKEKKSFKTFRKKFLDRCLELQHSALAGKVPGQKCSENSKLHLDEYLTMQQAQQSRKSLLDACLLAQRDVS